MYEKGTAEWSGNQRHEAHVKCASQSKVDERKWDKEMDKLVFRSVFTLNPG